MNIYAALPVMNEPDVEHTIRQILSQTLPPKALYVCVNQPDEYKHDADKQFIFEQNQQTIAYIRNQFPKVNIIDKSTHGWDSKNHGVGWARKLLMDTINEIANPEDIIISLDADTEYPPTYFKSVNQIFNIDTYPVAERSRSARPIALSNPYYHKLTGRKAEDRAMLRYEIYMRCYHLNLIRIGSPYAFTALGSAIAVRISAYRKMGGMAPKKSGEDFYFLQQLCKIGRVETKNTVVVYPATRLSNRVFFGTGPALIKGVNGDWNSYPIYSPKLWDEVAAIYQDFSRYFSSDDIQKFRANSKTEAQFQKFCHEKFDGLRILQYLKSHHAEHPQSDEIGLSQNLTVLGINTLLPSDFSFQTAKITLLDEIRDILFAKLNNYP
ncbi:MAG: hypothetical protein LBU91_01800 [Bacteroidales bacterium]|jgi:hypothetical protein|nr:hypothetical protein [Bacteroidales bacterium]